ncbi:MAG: hypothetical protein QOK48_3631 [Blastocatellia bacterium]|nr:hypothetical protein [Blastocatellia bacterium]
MKLEMRVSSRAFSTSASSEPALFFYHQQPGPVVGSSSIADDLGGHGSWIQEIAPIAGQIGCQCSSFQDKLRLYLNSCYGQVDRIGIRNRVHSTIYQCGNFVSRICHADEMWVTGVA